VSTEHAIELSGIDGGNPVGFLAALGVLRLIGTVEGGTSPRLSWTKGFRPVVHTRKPMSPEELSAGLADGLRNIIKEGVTGLGDIIGVECGRFEQFVEDAYKAGSECRLRFAAAFGSNAALAEKKSTIVPNQLSFSNGQGGKLLLKDVQKLVQLATPERLREALFEPWRYEDLDQPTFRWDPLDMRTGAHMSTDPGSTETRSVAAANALAFVGMSFLVSVPMAGGLQTTGFREIKGETYFTWPLWSGPLNADAVGCLLQQSDWVQEVGVLACFGARRIEYKKNLYLANSTAIDGNFEEA
jgi:hypothetical protein